MNILIIVLLLLLIIGFIGMWTAHVPGGRALFDIAVFFILLFLLAGDKIKI